MSTIRHKTSEPAAERTAGTTASARKRTRRRCGSATDPSLNGKAGDAGSSWPVRVRAHRRRQACVAEILDRTLGELAESDPRLWDRRAYLMLVGLVYERLATSEHEIETDELVALAKVLAENRRAEAKLRAEAAAVSERDGKESPDRCGPLPQRFADMVREVYGLDVAESPSA